MVTGMCATLAFFLVKRCSLSLGFIITHFHVGDKAFGDQSAPASKQKIPCQHLRSESERNTQEAGKIGGKGIKVTGVNEGAIV